MASVVDLPYGCQTFAYDPAHPKPPYPGLVLEAGSGTYSPYWRAPTMAERADQKLNLILKEMERLRERLDKAGVP
jgi:hypothetical protein